MMEKNMPSSGLERSESEGMKQSREAGLRAERPATGAEE
jgi:hypothetical protein